mmetsp:Transcript_51227/g.109045  ORF Transcript_51227/g.109045 Transcript_51227/m.109045 type:complete len:201 (-) Transcript_51227:1502-2104(-)
MRSAEMMEQLHDHHLGRASRDMQSIELPCCVIRKGGSQVEGIQNCVVLPLEILLGDLAQRQHSLRRDVHLPFGAGQEPADEKFYLALRAPDELPPLERLAVLEGRPKFLESFVPRDVRHAQGRQLHADRIVPRRDEADALQPLGQVFPQHGGDGRALGIYAFDLPTADAPLDLPFGELAVAAGVGLPPRPEHPGLSLLVK